MGPVPSFIRMRPNLTPKKIHIYKKIIVIKEQIPITILMEMVIFLDGWLVGLEDWRHLGFWVLPFLLTLIVYISKLLFN